jgi:hypothetical protein
MTSLEIPRSGSIWQHHHLKNFRIRIASVTPEGQVYSYCIQSGAAITPIHKDKFYKYWSEDCLPYCIYEPSSTHSSADGLVAPSPWREETDLEMPNLKRKRV